MPLVPFLGPRRILAHPLLWHRFTPYHALLHADGYVFEKNWEVTYFFFLNFSHCSSPLFHTISVICDFTPHDGYLCDSFIQILDKMVGTRSGIITTIPPKKEKTAMKAKDVKAKGLGLESNRHGVRVRGLRSNKRSDGQAGGVKLGQFLLTILLSQPHEMPCSRKPLSRSLTLPEK